LNEPIKSYFRIIFQVLSKLKGTLVSEEIWNDCFVEQVDRNMKFYDKLASWYSSKENNYFPIGIGSSPATYSIVPTYVRNSDKFNYKWYHND
jgi:hypothetical protein